MGSQSKHRVRDGVFVNQRIYGLKANTVTLGLSRWTTTTANEKSNGV